MEGINDNSVGNSDGKTMSSSPPYITNYTIAPENCTSTRARAYAHAHTRTSDVCVARKVEKVERINETGNGMEGKIDRNENVTREREREQDEERNKREMREKWRPGRTSTPVAVGQKIDVRHRGQAGGGDCQKTSNANSQYRLHSFPFVMGK